MNKLTDFAKGLVVGVLGAMLVFGVVWGFWILRNRDKELLEYAEKQAEIETLREDYGNRNAYEFLDAIPGVRRAADGANAEFERKRDEAVQRFRSGFAD